LCTGSPSLRGVFEPSAVADQGGVDVGASVDDVVVGSGTEVDACEVDGVGFEVGVDECDVGVAESDVGVVTGGLGRVVVVTRLAVLGFVGAGVIVTCVVGAGAGRTRR
jgi:hypothetical protein